MNRIEFMNRLEQLLCSLPQDERADALKYYNDYFDDAGPDREQEVIRELISPEHVAKTILGDMYQNTQSGWNTGAEGNSLYGNEQQINEDKMPVWAWVLLIATLPITLPIAGSVVCGIAGVFVGVCGVVLGLLLGGIGLFVAAIALFTTGFTGIGCLCIGIGAFLESIVFLLIPFGIWIFREPIPRFYSFVKNKIADLRRKGGTVA